MGIEIPNAPVRPKTPVVNKYGKPIKSKTENKEEEKDSKTVTVIENDSN